MDTSFVDHYAMLGLASEASSEAIRKAFRQRLLELHPDKRVEPVDSEQMHRVMRAFEILGDASRRARYDRLYEIRRISLDRSESELPHITESDRPQDRARAVLYYLLKGSPEEAVRRLDEFDGAGAAIIQTFLEDDEYVDACFLLGEYFETLRDDVVALEWWSEAIRRERMRRRHRPCYGEVLERSRRLLIQGMTSGADPRVALQYLARAEGLDPSRADLAEISKRRASCYLQMGMKVEAARHLTRALSLQPQVRGVARLQEQLVGYL